MSNPNDEPQVPPLASALYDVAGMRALDAAAMARPEIARGELMERAGQALLEALQRHWPRQRRIGVLCGPGNNGGDGYVLARLATEAGYTVGVYGSPSRAGAETDGRRTHDRWREQGGAVRPLQDFDPGQAELWVDGLFGIGLQRPLADHFGAVIERLNAAAVAVLAVDVPSGVEIDRGMATGPAVQATRTVTMIADKLGLRTGAAVDFAGEVEVACLGLPESIQEGVPPVARHVFAGAATLVWPQRRRNAHKGDCGHVLVVGGAPEYAGAARLTALAALRAGAGRVTLATHSAHAAWANATNPEIMVRAVDSTGTLLPLLREVDVVALGPGLGQESWGRSLWQAVVDTPVPKVLDADALNLLAALPRRDEDWVLTPHPGEAGRLLNTTGREIESDRPGALRALIRAFGGVVLLKGAGTLVADGGTQWPACITGGHSGMATAGSGDVLTGILAALRAQGLEARAAAETAAAWHCAAAREAAARLGGTVGMLAGDLVAALPATREAARDE